MVPDPHSNDNMIADDTAIWRYMDLPKFVSMLANEGLWFAKAATFQDDPYEGFRKVNWPDIPIPNGTSEVSFNQMIDHMKQLSAEYLKNARYHLYVNAWTLGESESMAMWQIYGSQACGIAVKSSVDQYK